MDFQELIHTRQSCRSYDEEKTVEQEKMRFILEAAQLAPSACNGQPYHITICTGEKALEVAKATQGMGMNKFASQAPVLLVISEENYVKTAALGAKIKGNDYRSIDIGIVEINERQNNGKYIRKQTEIDFVCNKGAERIYIQSSFALPSIEKEQQEKRSLNNVYDSFRKIVIVKEDILTRKDSNGIITMGLKDFITNKNSLDEI